MIALCSPQGLGYLARDFYNSGIIDYVYLHEHSSRPNNRHWYARESIVASYEELIEKCDVILGLETFFNWKVIPQAREKGKKTVLIPMYECTNNPLPYEPDLVLSPSLLDRDYYPESTLVQIPVDLTRLKPRLRKKAEVFVHNAGNLGLGGRNGTVELLSAMKYVKSPLKLILRSQRPIVELPKDVKEWVEEDDRIEVRIGTFDDIWDEGDVFIFPEKFNGLSLPIQEAYASGMVVMSTDRHPFNKWLPTEPLIPVDSYKKERLAVEFDMAVLSPTTIAKHIDSWYGRDIVELSNMGITCGQKISWRQLKPTYQKLLSK